MFRRSSSTAKMPNPTDSRDPSVSHGSSSSAAVPAPNGPGLKVANPDEPTDTTGSPGSSDYGKLNGKENGRAKPSRGMSRSSSLSNIFKRKDKDQDRHSKSSVPPSRAGEPTRRDNAAGAVEEKTYVNGVQVIGTSEKAGAITAGDEDPSTSSGTATATQRPPAIGDGHGGEDLVINNGSMPEEGGQGDRRRKPSMGHKARNRLSSIFNKDKDKSTRTDRSRSGSIASTNSGTPSTGLPPPVPPMPINHTYPGSPIADGPSSGMPSPSVSTRIRKPPPAPSSGSGTATPTKGFGWTGVNGSPLGESGSSISSSGGLAGLSLGKPILAGTIVTEPEALESRLETLRDSPTASSALTGSSAPPSPSTRSNLSAGPNGSHPRPNRDRASSLYSQWSYDFEADEDDSDGEVFLTPPEGLSEVEEEDEEEEERRDKRILAMNGIASKAGKQDDQYEARGEKELPSYDSGVAVNGSGGASQGERRLDANTPTASGLLRQESTPIIHRAAVDTSAGVSTRTRTQSATGDQLPPLDQAPILKSDIAEVQNILELFLTSHMKEAEAIVYDRDPTGQHMYIQNAGAVIQCIKAMMTFDVEDLKEALEIARGTSALAASIRKPQGSVVGRFAGLVRGSTGAAHVRNMTAVQKHAELVYAESLLIKAVLGIVAGGDWVGLIKEALNMRAAHGIYRMLQAYQIEVEADGTDPSLDEHFKSGVQLGTGLSSLMLSLLPGKVLKLAEIFGYAGDRKQALATLMAAGGWRSDRDEPTYNAEHDGIRRPICDMALLTFHLVISVLMPVSGVDVPMAKKILDYNMKRFPNGVFFMYFQSRLYTTQAQPELAQKQLQKALDLKLEYLQLQHICLWDMGVNSLMLGQFKRADECFRILTAESSWSKAVYMYSQAACLAELEETTGEALDDARLHQMMADVPKSMKKIAGKSLPVEKFVSRKARKYTGQGNRLLLAATELGYFFGALPNTPPRILYSVTIPRIKRQLDLMESATPNTYPHGADAYYDNLVLAFFLDGVSHSFAGYPHVEAIVTKEDVASYPMSAAEAGARSERSLLAVLEHGTKVKLDHWIIYHAHFELGRLYSHLGNNAEARRHLELVLSGRPLEVSPAVKHQGKYSMESALMLKAHAGLSTIKEYDQAKMH